jgi:Domain of unknown function (DUF397)
MVADLMWRKSSFSSDNGMCVELASLPWRKSSLSSDNGTCVELAPVPGDLVAVRDSKHPGGGYLVVRKALLLTVAKGR